ncbi:GGDEF domain-containing protein [Pseudonocardia sp. CA-107938]|uniref:GGDEF domain-containing protein n=1 Tax=Pseudonocardia sp. CA-107938 TaxID=3240021 RepID=UPI003D939937
MGTTTMPGEVTRPGSAGAAARLVEAADELAADGSYEQAYRHLRTAVRLLSSLTGGVDELDRLRREYAEAREQSRRDSLTSSYNRRYLDEHLAALLDDRTVRSSAGVSVAFVDADHFKQVNDRFGHRFGDRVLQCLVDELALDLPPGGFCARYGGEEFALVLPGCDIASAVRTCEAARHRVDSHDWAALDPALRVTVSIGVAHGVGPVTDVEQLVDAADTLLYAAKHSGRNAVAYRDEQTGLVRLAGAAAARRSIVQPA